MARAGAASLTVHPAFRGVLGRHTHDFLISGNQAITYLQAHLKTDIGFLQIHHHVIELYARLSQLKSLGLPNCVPLRITDALQRLLQFAGKPTAGNFVDPRFQVITSAGAGSAAAIAINADPVQEDVARSIRSRHDTDASLP